jgi:hypothetical protein
MELRRFKGIVVEGKRGNFKGFGDRKAASEAHLDRQLNFEPTGEPYL